MFDFICHWLQRPPTQFVRVMKFGYFCRTLFFYRVKSILLFSKLMIGKSQGYSKRSYVYLHTYTQICGRETIYAPMESQYQSPCSICSQAIGPKIKKCYFFVTPNLHCNKSRNEDQLRPPVPYAPLSYIF